MGFHGVIHRTHHARAYVRRSEPVNSNWSHPPKRRLESATNFCMFPSHARQFNKVAERNVSVAISSVWCARPLAAIGTRHVHPRAHLRPAPTAAASAAAFSELLSKRMFGFINWQKKRRNIHLFDTLGRLIAEVKKQSPDHIAVTGDLVNLALPDEYLVARNLAGTSRLAARRHARRRQPRTPTSKRWSANRSASGARICAATIRPSQRFRSCAGADRSPSSTFDGGRIRADARDRQARRGTTHASSRHPEKARRGRRVPYRLAASSAGSEPRRKSQRLLDGRALIATIAQAGADLVIHGHEHVHSVAWIDGAGRRVPVVGVPSASASPRGHWQPAGFNLYRIEGSAGAWRCEVASWSMNKSGEMIETGRRILTRGN